jgi:hypothetical protein
LVGDEDAGDVLASEWKETQKTVIGVNGPSGWLPQQPATVAKGSADVASGGSDMSWMTGIVAGLIKGFVN